MLDVMNRYAHGFVVVALTLASRRGGLIQALERGENSVDQLCDELGANSGHLRVTLRLFQSLGWIDACGKDSFRPLAQLQVHKLIPDDVWPLYELDMETYLKSGTGGRLQAYLPRARARWGLENDQIADFLDSLLCCPILAQLKKREVLNDLVETNFKVLPAGVREEVIEILEIVKWLEGGDGHYKLTPSGEFMFERSMNLGVGESYRPMLADMDNILFGDPLAIFGLDENGDELHVDRAMNVIASGFMHDRFFSQVEEMLVSIFNKEPLSAQPRYVADMGSGDGTFLKRVYDTVVSKTKRGQHLDEYPLTMVGVDINQASLKETSKTLGKIPHEVVIGDIGKPAEVASSLRKIGVDADEVLHIRSFLDHDRPFIEPTDLTALAAREQANYLGAYVKRDGNAVSPAVAVQSLVEHLDRWSEIINPHGFILLEVHCQDPLVIREYTDESESLYFDAIEGYSHQYLIEADAALMAAAEAGLFPRRDYFRKFPGVLPYCRITLNLYERMPYRVRMALPTDMPALLALESALWEPSMQTGEAEIARRIRDYPLGQWVLEMDKEIVGVVYSQRINDIDDLNNARIDALGDLHAPNGSVVQLLGLNVLPEKQHLSLGDQLLDLMLMRSAVQGGVKKVAGLTRCKDFKGRTIDELSAYIAKRDEDGRPVDPILRFHHKHGAAFIGPVPEYRPADTDNLGAGVLLCYDFSAPGTDLRSSQNRDVGTDLSADTSLRGRLEFCLRTVLNPSQQDQFSWSRSFRDMGVDSLGLLELRTLLSQVFEQSLSPTFFFAHPTLESIQDFLENGSSQNDESLTDVDLGDSGAAQDAGVEEISAVTPASSNEAIAIVGLSAKFPGANSAQEYWELLRDGKDAIRKTPASRWDADAWYSDDPDADGKIITRDGGFLSCVDEFDASFFGISPNEARLMDPQQRLLLELNWEALEHAGINPHALKGTALGVFVGLYSHDYELLQVQAGNTDDLGAYYATGNSASIAAGRLAYFLGTHGPAMSIDTACSSSLVAVHEAVQSLRSGQSNLALASGVSLMLSPRLSVIFSKAGMLSPEGRCKTFDDSADGYVRSEGCAAVVLKRLSDARADGDRVLGIISGTCINQDGASNGLTAPNMLAQQQLLRGALDNAGLAPHQIDYIEAHGTGTKLGDPVEFGAIQAVFGADKARTKALLLGSAKTNIGHTEAAAGLAGLVKVVQSMQAQTMPAHLHLSKTNSMLDLNSVPAEIPLKTQAWVSDEGPLRAGVSSFGFSGTNAHLIVEQDQAGTFADDKVDTNQLLCVSARSDMALTQLMAKHARALGQLPDNAVADYCYTANTGRAQFAHRVSVSGRTGSELSSALQAVNGQAESVDTAARPKVAFVFTGQGSQYLNMARELAQSEPVFRRHLSECQRLLQDELPTALSDLLYASADDTQALERLNDTLNTQPALFAVEYALAKTLIAWGLEPAVVMGHSVGEYVAACIAGVFSLQDGLKLIAARGRLMGSLPAGGGMCAVLGPKAKTLGTIEGHAEISIAAFNGPENIVLSGPVSALDAVTATLESAGQKVVALPVSHAFHSPLMEPILPIFGELARWVSMSSPSIPLISNLNGQLAGEEISSGEYWVSHLRESVQFESSVETLLDQSIDMVIEIGPHPVLTAMGEAIAVSRDANDKGPEWLGTLIRGESDKSSLLKTLGRSWELGAIDSLSMLYPSTQFKKISVPTYPWQRKSHWFEDRSFDRAADAGMGPELYEPAWLVRSLLSQSCAGRSSPDFDSPDALAKVAMASRASSRETYSRGDLPEALDRICLDAVVNALLDLGWNFSIGQEVNAQSVLSALNILPKYERLTHRLLQILAEDGYMQETDRRFAVLKDLPEGTASLQLPEAGRAECPAEYALFSRCSGRLAEVLDGRCDPLELLFPGGDLTDAINVYTDSPFATTANEMLVRVVQQFVDTLPQGRSLRILEIGAGTGGTTKRLLPLLPVSQTEYLFTDVSEAFLNKAQARFSDFPFMRYALFDAESDPASQGFAVEQFDLVIASNVLHATSDLSRTVKHSADQLSPGGTLLLVEGQSRTRWIDLVFGLTEGWWRFDDTELRPDYPLINGSAWSSLLKAQAFDEVSVTPTTPPDATRESPADLFNQSVIVARKSRAGTGADEALDTLAHLAPPCIVLADQGGLAARLPELMEPGQCDLVYLGDKPADGPALHAVSDASELAQVLSTLVRKDTVVVNLWPLDLPNTEADGSALLDAVAAAGMQQVDLIRAAAQAAVHNFLSVSRGAQGVHGAEQIHLTAASLAGLNNVAWAEYPDLRLRQLDLDGEAGVYQNLEALLQELSVSDDDLRTAYRQGQRFVQHLSPVTIADDSIDCYGDGVYLLVGGMGDLGMFSAQYLVEQGARHLVLAGRNNFPARDKWSQLADDPILGQKIEIVKAMEAAGARVDFEVLNIEKAGDVDVLLNRLRSYGPIRGLIQSAAVISDELIQSVRADNYKTVLGPKVAGTWYLLDALAKDDLDFCVFYSSIGSVVGLPGQASYAAANAVLDAMAKQGQALSSRCLSINWCGWEGTGLARTEGGQRAISELRLIGIEPLEALEAVRHVGRALNSGRPQISVVPLSSQNDDSQFAGVDPQLLDIRKHLSDASPVAKPEVSKAATAVQALAPGDTQAVRDLVTRTVSELLDLNPDSLTDDSSLGDLGMDSLLGLEFRKVMQSRCGLVLSATLVWNYPTIGAIVEHIDGKLNGVSAKQETQTRSDAPASSGISDVDELSDEEALQQLVGDAQAD